MGVLHADLLSMMILGSGLMIKSVTVHKKNNKERGHEKEVHFEFPAIASLDSSEQENNMGPRLICQASCVSYHL